jgi:uncharacterized protein YdeI (YjbR/CyaY-like superfamily)
MKKIHSVEEYTEEHTKWRELLVQLRTLLLKTELEESVKWNSPVYTLKGKNVIGFGAFKNHVGLWFFQGVFLEDKAHKLVNAQEGKTKALRQWRFDSNDINDVLLLESYIFEAIENQKLSKGVKVERKKDVFLPELLLNEFINNTEFKSAFEKLTPGKQREYAGYIAEAKRVTTQQNRLKKITPMIHEGKGLHDKYKNC